VYAAGTLPSYGRHAIKYEIIEIKFDLNHKLHKTEKKTKIWAIYFFLILNLEQRV